MEKKIAVYLLALCMILSVMTSCSRGSVDVSSGETKDLIGEETTLDSGLNWKEQYDLGIRLLSEGKYEEAILAFTAAIQIDPKSAVSYVERANAYLTWAGAVVQDAYASLGEGETLVWSDITVSTAEGDKTIGDLFQNAADDFAKADELIKNGESTDELDAEAAKDAADKADALTDDEEIQKFIDAICSAATALTEARRPLGYRTVYEDSADGSSIGWTKYYYDENDRRIGTAYVQEDGTENEMAPIYYDANGHEFPTLWGSYAYQEVNGDGLITALGSSADRVSKRFFYDVNGNLIRYEDGEHYRTEYIYDGENRLIQKEYYNAFGLDDMTYYTYDSEGRLIQKQSIAYYSSGNRTPNYINYQYDDAGRLVYQETLDGNGEPYIWTSYTYNDVGELISEYHWYEPNPEFGGPYTYYYIYE